MKNKLINQKYRVIKKASSVLMATILVVGMSVPSYAANIEGEREETVYGILNSDGSVNELIVTEHIQKNKELKGIQVQSDLENIKMLMSQVEYSEQGGSISFTTEESDIYYRGSSRKQLPVVTSITYELDGTKMTAAELKGQSGHLIMTLHQNNLEKRTIEINGVSEETFLPFESAVVVNLDNNHYENVSVSTGKVMDDGSMKVVTALLSPGLNESLEGIESEFITDTLTIEADVTDLELSSIYMTTICKLPEIDFSKYLGEFEDMDGKIDEFVTAGEELVAGASDLDAGVDTYFGKQTEAFNSFNTYFENDKNLLTGVIDFNNALVDFDSGLQLYLAGVTNLVTGVHALSEASPSLASGLTEFKAGLSMTLPNNEQTAPLFMALDQLEAGAIALDSGLQEAATGANLLSQNTPVLSESSTALVTASSTLSYGAAQLVENISPIIEGIEGLSEAAISLQEGSQVLSDGTAQFKEEGIDSLASEVETSLEKIRNFQKKYNELVKLVNEYSSFSTESENLTSEVTFIFKTVVE